MWWKIASICKKSSYQECITGNYPKHFMPWWICGSQSLWSSTWRAPEGKLSHVYNLCQQTIQQLINERIHGRFRNRIIKARENMSVQERGTLFGLTTAYYNRRWQAWSSTAERIRCYKWIARKDEVMITQAYGEGYTAHLEISTRHNFRFIIFQMGSSFWFNKKIFVKKKINKVKFVALI